MTASLPSDVHARLTALPDLPAADGPGLALGVYLDGHLVHGAGHGLASVEHRVPISPYSLFDIASVSKQFTAACVLQLALAGQVDLDADLRATHFPELQLDVPITARQCLHHTAGLRDFFSLLELAGRPESDVPDDDAVVAFLARQRGTSFPPGERHLYSNSGYVTLSALVKRVTGSSLRVYGEKAVFGPLGMTSTHYRDDPAEAIHGRANGHAPRDRGGWSVADAPFGVVGDGGLLTNLVDLARWVDFLQTGQVLGRELRDALHVRAVLNDGTVHSYAGGLDHEEHRGVQTIGHGGAFVGFRSHLLRAPAHGVGVAVLGNRADLAAQPVALSALYVVLDHLGVELAPVPDRSAGTGGAVAPPWRLGVWRDPDTALYARTSESDGEQRIDVMGLALTARPAGSRYVLDGVPLPLEVEVEADRLVLLLAGESDGLPSYLAVAATEMPAGLIGRYRSEELDATAEIVDVDGTVRLRIAQADPKELRPGIAGEIWHTQLTIRLVIDGDRAAALEMSNGRALGLRFDRIEP